MEARPSRSRQKPARKKPHKIVSGEGKMKQKVVSRSWEISLGTGEMAPLPRTLAAFAEVLFLPPTWSSSPLPVIPVPGQGEPQTTAGQAARSWGQRRQKHAKIHFKTAMIREIWVRAAAFPVDPHLNTLTISLKIRSGATSWNSLDILHRERNVRRTCPGGLKWMEPLE